MKYTLIDNIKYLYKRAFKTIPSLKITLPLEIVCTIVSPILAIIMSSLVVELITKGTSVNDFLLNVGAVSIVWVVVVTVETYFSRKREQQQTIIRSIEFSADFSKKSMDKDYVNIEPYDKQLLSRKALEGGLNSNWVGIEFFYKSFPLLIQNGISLIIYSTLISSLDIWVFIVLTVMTLSNMILSRRARDYEQKHKDEYVKYNKKINYLYEEAISAKNGKDIRLYKMEKWFKDNFESLIKIRKKWFQKINFLYFLPEGSDQLLLLVRDLLAYGKLIELVFKGDISLSMFTLYIGAVSSFSKILADLVMAYTNVKRANLGVIDYRIYEDIENVYNHNKGVDISGIEFPITIEFKNVSFRYPGTDKDIIKNLNLKIKSGEKVALVGVNGAGKTTLVKLLSGLYYPSEGEILISGYPITAFNIEEYYQLFGVVFQDVQTLAFTIEENVMIDKSEEDKDMKRFWKALEQAELKEKIMSLPKKEKTYITQALDKDGIQLSGGEMQRLMLARALYKDAPLLILDEPTSALDPIVEANLYEKYYQLTKEKTSIFISHRLSSTKFCDRVLFFEYGEVIEDGTHVELLELNGKYAEMYQIQSHYYQEGELVDERVF